MFKSIFNLRKVAKTVALLAVFSLFANSLLAQDFNYIDPISGMVGKYSTGIQYGAGCPAGVTCVALTEVISIPSTVEIFTLPETVMNGATTYRLSEIHAWAIQPPTTYSNVKEIIYPNSIVWMDNNWNGAFPNLHKITFGKDLTFFRDAAADCPSMDSIVFLGDKVFNAVSAPELPGGTFHYNIAGSFNNCPADVKIIIPCGTMSKFTESVNFGTGKWMSWANITAANLVEAECLNTLTVLSSNNSLGNAWSMNGGQIITSTPANTSADYSGTATLIALPQGGKLFVGWSDGNLDNPRTVTVSSDTTFTANFATCETSGVEQVRAASAGIRVYPNPAGNTLNVEAAENVTDGALTLFDMNGKAVLSQAINGNTAQMNLSALASGNYILRLVENGTAHAGVQVIKE